MVMVNLKSASPRKVSHFSLDAASGLNATEVVIVSNVGDADLHISDIYLNDDTGPFSFSAISALSFHQAEQPSSRSHSHLIQQPTMQGLFLLSLMIPIDPS